MPDCLRSLLVVAFFLGVQKDSYTIISVGRRNVRKRTNGGPLSRIRLGVVSFRPCLLYDFQMCPVVVEVE